MTNPTRTRAEIQAEIEKLEQELENTWPQKGAQAYCKAEVADSEDDDAEILIYGTDCFTTVPLASLIPAADLIPRAEHEAALAEAVRGVPLKDRIDSRDAVAYLVNAMYAPAMPRSYTHDHNGNRYRVTVERVERDLNVKSESTFKADASDEPRYHDDSAVNKAFVDTLAELQAMTPEAFVEWLKADKPGPIAQLIQAAESDAEPVGWFNQYDNGVSWYGHQTEDQAKRLSGCDALKTAIPLYRHPAPIHAPQATAVAPVGVVEEIREAAGYVQRCNMYYVYDLDKARKEFDAALSRITVLPEPESGVDDWVSVHFVNRHGDVILDTGRTEKQLLLMDANRLIRAAQEASEHGLR